MSRVARLAAAVAKEPGRAELVLELARAHADAGSWQNGVVLLQQAARLHPTHRQLARERVAIPIGAGQWMVAVREATAVLGAMPDHAMVWALLAHGFTQLGRRKSAVQAWQTSLSLQPDNTQGWFELGNLLTGLMQLKEAVGAYQRALACGPPHAALLGNLGAALLHLGRFDASERCLRQAIELDASLPSAHVCLAQVLGVGGDEAGARDAFRSAVAVAPERVATRIAFGGFLVSHGYPDEAQQQYHAVLARVPGHVGALMGLGTIQSRLGRHHEAVATLRPLLDNSNLPISVLAAYGRSCIRTGDVAEARALLERHVGGTQTPTSLQELHHTLGALCEAEGDHAAAFQHHTVGNRHREHDVQPATLLRQVAETCSILRAPTARDSTLGTGMVFIVGMLRSGTSLTEQILARHPAVVPGGELPYLASTLTDGNAQRGGKHWARCLVEGSPADWDALGEAYLSRACAAAGIDRAALGTSCILTDKQPTNYIWLGALSRILPGARIIHCERDPLDTCLSCFFQNFGPGHAWSTELEWIADIYRSYRSQMDWWTKQVGLETIPVRYEALVQDLETEVKGLLDALGLPFHADCLRFHESRRDVRTASVDQVRRPIYQTSKGRAEHYREWLGPLRVGLGDLDALPAAPDLVSISG